MIGDRQRGAVQEPSVKVMTLPRPFSVGETLKISAFDSAVMIEGGGQPLELRHGESASFISVAVEDDLPVVTRRWERVAALP